MQDLFIEFLPPWVETGLQPAFYDRESGTVLQQTARMYAKVNELVKAVNGMDKIIKEYVDYIDNYFKNLDVQEEINNKLDGMAEGGELAEIIAQYANLPCIHAYATISDMASSENLEDGSYARAMSKTVAGTGDGAYYKIRETVEGDDPDGENLVAITGTTLVAEIIPDYAIESLSAFVNAKFDGVDDYVDDNLVNVKYNGAVGDGVTDDTQAIQDLIDNNHLKTLFFPDGKYLLSAPLQIGTTNAECVSLKLSPNAVIMAKENEGAEYLIEIGKQQGTWDRYEEGNCCIIDGGLWDAENCTIGAIHHIGNRKESQFLNMQVMNAHKGFVLDIGNGSSSSSDVYMSNLNIFGRSSYEDGSIGIEIYGYDNKINNVRMARFQTGVYDASGNYFNNIHVLMSEGGVPMTDAQFNKTTCYVHTGNGGDSKLIDFYNDTCAIGFVQEGNNFTSLIHCFQYWWKSSAGANIVLYRSASGSPSELNITDCNVQLPATANTVKGLDLVDPDGGSNLGYRQYIGIYDNIKITNHVMHNTGKIALTDWIYCTDLDKTRGTVIAGGPWINTMTANTYYPIAYLKEGFYSLLIRAGNYQMIRVNLNVGATVAIESVENIFSHSQSGVLTVALCNAGNDSDNLRDAYLCVKSNTNGLGFNFSISDIHSWNEKVFVKRNYFNALTNPTVNSSSSFNPA